MTDDEREDYLVNEQQNTLPPSAPATGSGAVEAEHCPVCDWPGIYIRTRYFKGGSTADVWMCDNAKCRSYRLYWHKDKPPNKDSATPVS